MQPASEYLRTSVRGRRASRKPSMGEIGGSGLREPLLCGGVKLNATTSTLRPMATACP